MITFLLFLFGACLGSFINCLVYRCNKATKLQSYKDFILGRSVCDHCGKQLSWYDNLPLISYLLLRGKCRQCQSPISRQYFLVELISGILLVVTMQQCNNATMFNCSIAQLLASFILLSLVALFISDLNYQTIPDLIIFLAILTALGYKVTMLQSYNAAMETIAIFTPTALFFLLSRLKIRGQQAMGFGDVELVFLMGLFLGWPKILLALYAAFLTGAALGVILILRGKKKLQSAIPFGPFLIAGTFLAYFGGEIIWQKILGVIQYWSF